MNSVGGGLVDVHNKYRLLSTYCVPGPALGLYRHCLISASQEDVM